VSDERFPAVPLLTAALGCRCPRCGRGKVFDGILNVTSRCAVCDLDISAQDAGDGPAVFVILLLGAVVVGLAILVEVKFEPPLWLHAVLWLPVTLGGAIAYRLLPVSALPEVDFPTIFVQAGLRLERLSNCERDKAEDCQYCFHVCSLRYAFWRGYTLWTSSGSRRQKHPFYHLWGPLATDGFGSDSDIRLQMASRPTETGQQLLPLAPLQLTARKRTFNACITIMRGSERG